MRSALWSSARRPRVSAPRPDRVRPALKRLSAQLARALVGQAEARTGLLLALVAGEHAYLEGPPGCGKTRLAEALCAAASRRVAALRFHRDTREADLLGDPVLRLQWRGDLQRLWRGRVPGPLLRAELVVLDDLSRAPGEALTPLLRVLGERRVGGQLLPLETAVATALPPELELYGDPLEPTQLDRFAVQVRMRGLVLGSDWKLARRALERGASPLPGPPLSTETRAAVRAAAARLPLSEEICEALRALVERLTLACPAEVRDRLSDRSFAGAAPRILRAHALLRGATRVEAVDLSALRFLLGRRVPEEVQRAFPALLAEPADAVAVGPQGPPGAVAGARAGEAGSGARVAVAARDLRRDQGLSGAAPPEPLAPAEVSGLLAALRGRIERGRADRRDHPGGVPRRYRRLRTLDEIEDADPFEAALFVAGRLAEPRVHRRERRDAGGSLALLRDVSASMEGRLSRWAGQVVAGLVRLGAQERMRLGYVEFNHEATRFGAEGRFFHRRYPELLGLAARRRAEGRTNYEAPLALALFELRRRPGRNRHVVLLTDGMPVLGDPAVHRERGLARSSGIRIHTVYLGLGDCPPVLDEISSDTGGLRFAGRTMPDGRLVIDERV